MSVAFLDEANECPLDIDEAYGAGNKVTQDGTAQLQFGCVSHLKEIYGGAREADLNGNVELTVTSGHFDRVFGGNKFSGDIKGTITVNVEETGCNPIIIGELYGGGNEAPYQTPAGGVGPTLNVRSFTSIGNIYGGGYGAAAVVTGDTHVNIEACIGSGSVGRAGAIGTITGNVYGGGNEAKVEGNTHVNIGTKLGQKHRLRIARRSHRSPAHQSREGSQNPRQHLWRRQQSRSDRQHQRHNRKIEVQPSVPLRGEKRSKS